MDEHKSKRIAEIKSIIAKHRYEYVDIKDKDIDVVYNIFVKNDIESLKKKIYKLSGVVLYYLGIYYRIHNNNKMMVECLIKSSHKKSHCSYGGFRYLLPNCRNEL